MQDIDTENLGQSHGNREERIEKQKGIGEQQIETSFIAVVHVMDNRLPTFFFALPSVWYY